MKLDESRLVEARPQREAPQAEPGVSDENANGQRIRFRRPKACRPAGPPGLQLLRVACRDYLHCGYDGSGPAIAGRSFRTEIAHMMSWMNRPMRAM
jgi:hypothetical protein